MQTCPLHRAWLDAVPTKREARPMRVAITLSNLLGWHALADLLAAIPDSNDDFGVF
jgi:hypothetical protein